MLSEPSLTGRVAPIALRAAGCATAFFLGGPLAAAMAAYGGDALVTLLHLSDQSNIKKFPEAVAGNLANFIAAAAYDQIKGPDAGSLRSVFRDALRASLRAIRAEYLPTLAQPDRDFYQGWFDRWDKRLQTDRLEEFQDPALLTRFIRADGETVEEAVGVVLIEILMRLDVDGFLKLERRRIDVNLETALTERLPVHVPIQLSLALADRDRLWKVVQDQKISLILRTLETLAPAKVEAMPARLVRAESPILLPRQGVYVGSTDSAEELADRLASRSGELIYVYGAPGIGKTSLCRAALRRFLADDPSATALFFELQAASDLPTMVAACADALGNLALKSEGEVRQQITRLADLQAGPLVLYFDNFESVARAAGVLPFVRSLTGINGVRVLCSTRWDLSSAVGAGLRG